MATGVDGGARIMVVVKASGGPWVVRGGSTTPGAGRVGRGGLSGATIGYICAGHGPPPADAAAVRVLWPRAVVP